MSTWLALGLLVVSGLILVLYHDQGSIGGMDSSNFAALMASLALLIWLGSSVLRDYSGQYGKAIKDIISWAGIALLLVTFYTFRNELLEGSQRVMQQVLPAGTHINLTENNGESTTENATVRLRIRDDGHFVIRTLTNNKPITMLVDTGATNVVLSTSDARSLGIDTNKLNYVVPISTANGNTMAARATIDSISIGPIRVNNIDALIAKDGDLNQSLLGMSFLRRLRSYEVTGDFLILRS